MVYRTIQSFPEAQPPVPLAAAVVRDQLARRRPAKHKMAREEVGPFFEDVGHFDVERHPAYVPRLRTFIHGETAEAPATMAE